jgi:hypothetical protein
MQGKLLSHAAIPAAEPEQGRPQLPLNPYAEFLFRIAERFGVPTVLCVLVLWWAKTGIVQPLMDAHFQFIAKIVEGQDRHAEGLAAVGDKLDTLIQVSRHAAQKEAAE